MKAIALSLLALCFCMSFAGGQRPVRPGVRKAEKLPDPADVPPLRKVHPQLADPGQLKRDADELAMLAQSIPPEIQQAAQGRLPKDVNERLKKIEKLSKRLRRALSP